MKKIAEKFSARVLLIAMCLATVYTVNAQEGGQNRDMQQNKERIEAQKVAFITNKLDLNSAEAEKFWPVYNDYFNQLKTKQKTWRDQHDFKPDDINKMSDAEASEFAEDQLNHEQEILDLRKDLITNLNGVISPQKILMLLDAEKEFRIELMRKVSHSRGIGEGRDENRR